MKGRVYDPLASRFTTADPLMQAPYWSQGMNRYAYVFNDPVNATDPSGFLSMSNIVGAFVAVGHAAGFVLPAIANGSLPTLGAVGVPTVATSVTTMPGLLQGQPGSGPTAVAADTPSMQEGARGNPAKAAGPKSAGPDPMLCDSGLFECDWEAGTMRMNILIPDAPVGPAPAAGQTASWWARLKNWLFGAEPAANGVRTALQGLRAGKNAGVRVVESAEELQSLFGRLSSGGKVVQGSSYPGKLVELGDKTTVGLRAVSKSGGPAIDIKLPGGELWKVHIQ